MISQNRCGSFGSCVCDMLAVSCDGDDFVEMDPSGRYGRYNEVLGRGASKTVYKAFDEIDGIEVAWNQVVIEDLLQIPKDLDRLYYEVRLLKTLKHKNVIKFYHSWLDAEAQTINFITEIFTSGTLRQYRKRHKHADMKAVKNWARQILRGLLYLHSHDPPVIHRDLKCDNIFVNGSQGEVKIGDLGLATIIEHTNAAAHSVIGTPQFMAPELYEEEYTELVDIYSFGMCLLEMVTFEYPYSECTNAAQIYKKVTSGKKPEALNKVMDPELRRFIEMCLAPASERPAARELLVDSFLQLDAHKEAAEDDYLSPKSQQGSIMDNSIDRMSIITEDSSEANTDTRNFDSMLVQTNSSEMPSTKAAVDMVVDWEGQLPVTEIIDLTVKGKKRENDTVFLRLQIADSQGDVRNIHFPFDLEVDSAMSVASEMVVELDLADQDVTKIAEMIDTAILELVPEWKPGVSIDDDDDNGNDNNNDKEEDGWCEEQACSTSIKEIEHWDGTQTSASKDSSESLVELQGRIEDALSFDCETWTNIGPGRPCCEGQLFCQSQLTPALDVLTCSVPLDVLGVTIEAEDEDMVIQEELFLALNYERELKELQRKHEEDFLELRKRWQTKGSLSSLSSSSSSSTLVSTVPSQQEACDMKNDDDAACLNMHRQSINGNGVMHEHEHELELELSVSLNEIKTGFLFAIDAMERVDQSPPAPPYNLNSNDVAALYISSRKLW